MSREYIEQRNGGYYVAGTRVSLDSVVLQFRDGASPETILQCFPALVSLANVYGAIAFALDNTELVDRYLGEQEKKWEAVRRAHPLAKPVDSGSPEMHHPPRKRARLSVSRHADKISGRQ